MKYIRKYIKNDFFSSGGHVPISFLTVLWILIGFNADPDPDPEFR
jgi:hypothetical protein